MTDYQLVKLKLEQCVPFRERKYRARYLSILALRKTGLEDRHRENRPISTEELADFAIAFDSYRRAWTGVLRENEELRGSDYEPDKTILVQKKQTELGYEENYFENVKQLRAL